MRPKKPDKMDLRIAEIEAKVVTEIRHQIVQEYLEHCKKEHSYCPLLKSTKICRTILDTLEEETSFILQERSKSN